MIKTSNIEYRDGETVLEGYCAYDDKISGKRPVVLVVHDWSGRNELACKKAEKLAELGYVGFAVDMYGKGRIGKTNEEKSALMKPLADNRENLQKRILAGFETAKKLEQADVKKMGVIGFCFGGLCALDLARSGADISAAVSFHGLLHAPQGIKNKKIHAKILVLHGHDDPMVTPDKVLDFENEMTAEKVDWQVHVYSNTMHAFTNPLANDPAFGTVYNPLTEKRAWIAMENLFEEVFA
jgi:dienelactone hydrolase